MLCTVLQVPAEKACISKLCKRPGQLPHAGRQYTRDYEGLVDLSQAMVKGRDARGQQLAVLSVLRSLMPEQAAVRFRKWFPLSQARPFLVYLKQALSCSVVALPACKEVMYICHSCIKDCPFSLRVQILFVCLRLCIAPLYKPHAIR